MSKVAAARTEFFDKVRFEFGAIREITRAQVKTVVDKYDLAWPHWFLNDVDRRVGRGVYSITEHGATPAAKVQDTKQKVSKLPAIEPTVAVAMVAPSVLSHNAEQIGRAHV